MTEEEMRREAAIRRVARKRGAAAERALRKIAQVLDRKFVLHADAHGEWGESDQMIEGILQNFYDTFGGFDEDQ